MEASQTLGGAGKWEGQEVPAQPHDSRCAQLVDCIGERQILEAMRSDMKEKGGLMES